jgi:hypothetical protein
MAARIAIVSGGVHATARVYSRSRRRGVSLAITASWPTPIEAHDIYMKLVDSAGESCCSEHDCRPAHYRMTAAGVEMPVGEEWIVIPNVTIQYRTLEGDTGETAGGHWCGSTKLATLTYCAVLPPSSASSIKADGLARWRFNSGRASPRGLPKIPEARVPIYFALPRACCMRSRLSQ